MKIDTSDMVTIQPYFKAKPGKMPEINTLLPAFVAKTATEAGNIFYDFTINGEEIFCREGYNGAEAALAHLDNVGALLGEMLKLADLARFEIHGPAAELETLKSPLANLKPAWFVRHDG
jgi:quinol monooxygenase YgiN